MKPNIGETLRLNSYALGLVLSQAVILKYDKMTIEITTNQKLTLVSKNDNK
jgi:hypothetical protein